MLGHYSLYSIINLQQNRIVFNNVAILVAVYKERRQVPKPFQGTSDYQTRCRQAFITTKANEGRLVTAGRLMLLHSLKRKMICSD